MFTDTASSDKVPLTLSVLEVVAPQRPDFVLTAHIPHCEADVLVFYSFNIKTWTEERNMDESQNY